MLERGRDHAVMMVTKMDTRSKHCIQQEKWVRLSYHDNQSFHQRPSCAAWSTAAEAGYPGGRSSSCEDRRRPDYFDSAEEKNAEAQDRERFHHRSACFKRWD